MSLFQASYINSIDYHNQKYSGGRYIYKRWGKDSEGNRFAFKTSRNSNPELQSTYLYNQDGKESLRYIRLDISV